MNTSGCNQTKNISGQIFGRLTVKELVPKDKRKFKQTTWLCICSCDGREVQIKANNLIQGITKSCGCLRFDAPKLLAEDFTGKVFGRLTVLSFAGYNDSEKRIWNCKCECGNEIIAIGQDLASKHKRSCNCLRNELGGQRVSKYSMENRKYTPEIATMMDVFVSYQYDDGDLTPEIFYEMTQQNCFYCDAKPSNKANRGKRKSASQYVRDNAEFIYNGLDRINSNLPHNFDNCVPCCKKCNLAKRNRDVFDFINQISKIYNKCNNKDIYEIRKEIIIPNDLNKWLIDNKFIQNNKTTNKYKQSKYTNKFSSYKDGLISDDVFTFMCSLPCIYCGSVGLNKRKLWDGKYYIHNGLDRIDNNLDHKIDNCVPCCKYCNYAKRDHSYNEFMEIISNIYNNLPNIYKFLKK